MANIKGKDGSKSREMIATIKLPSNTTIKDGVHKVNAKAFQSEVLGADKSIPINIQMNNIGLAPENADPNPYLFTQKGENAGKTVYNHGVFYSNKERQDGGKTQVQELLQYCEKYSVANGYASFPIKGDVGIRKAEEGGLYVKTETMQPSEQAVTATLNVDQFKATRAAQNYAKQHQKEAGAEKSAAVAQAQATAAEAEAHASAEAGMEEPAV